jgi:hypothetical protein
MHTWQDLSTHTESAQLREMLSCRVLLLRWTTREPSIAEEAQRLDLANRTKEEGNSAADGIEAIRYLCAPQTRRRGKMEAVLSVEQAA